MSLEKSTLDLQVGSVKNDTELGFTDDKGQFTKRNEQNTKDTDPYSYQNAYTWLFSCLSRNQVILISVAFFVTIVEGYLKTVTPTILGDIVDIVEIDSDDSWDSVKAPILKIVAALFGKEACTFIRKFIIEYLGTEYFLHGMFQRIL